MLGIVPYGNIHLHGYPSFVSVLVVDEISITSDLYFNAKFLQFKGFEDYLSSSRKQRQRISKLSNK
jgi:hypothetical protein